VIHFYTSKAMPYRPTVNTERRRAATRERVVAAARELIAHGGYREAQVAAVAARAGVATGTVYRHFPSKADLFAEVFRTVSQGEVDAARRAAEAAGASEDTSTARLRAAIETFARRALRARRQAWALLAEPVDPAVEAERLVFRRAHAAHFAAILRDGIARGELPAQDADVVGAALVGALGEALVGPLSPVAPRADPDALTATLVAFCLRSVTEENRRDVHARP
jgi:AcrR family transcriptional regulator